ncbi:hypothetical protein BGZ76_004923 [Entomortierella beljakovae]|nr:hypothetical protein BGZ76_004923 [Entomortierella beljakovae]
MMNPNDPPIEFNPECVYTFEEFKLMNDWLRVHTLEIANEPVSHFEFTLEGKLIPVSMFPFRKAAVVSEIIRQINNWNTQSRRKGVVTGSTSAYNFSTTGGKDMRTPTAAFLPKKIYRSLNEQQLETLDGDPFYPTFVVEVQNVSSESKLQELTDKFMNVYIPAGVQLGWLIDVENQKIFTFNPDRQSHEWKDIDAGDVLPGFKLDIQHIDKFYSQN